LTSIVVTNDDGVYSPGLHLLYEGVRDLGDVFIVAPVEPKSAVGLGLTLHKPIRVEEMVVNGLRIYGINGTPSDAVHVAHEMIAGDISLLASGVNIGDNTSVQNILASGTIGAAAEAALAGVKAIAFSADVSHPEQFKEDGYRRALLAAIKTVARYVLEHGLPEDVDVISVNFPRQVRGGVRVVPPARLRWWEKLDRRVDPRGRPYFWLYGEPVSPEPNTDVYVVHVEGGVAITPLKLDLGARRIEAYGELEELAAELSDALAGLA